MIAGRLRVSDFANFVLVFAAFASWCNGSTRDSGSLCLGSNPSEAAIDKSERITNSVVRTMLLNMALPAPQTGLEMMTAPGGARTAAEGLRAF